MTTFKLKITALATMIIDHIGSVWSMSIPNSFFLRCIGRIAFPIYAFLIAEGCRRTKNIKKYMLRLGIFALISEIPFDLAFASQSHIRMNDPVVLLTFRSQTVLSLGSQNIFFNLFLSVTAIYAWEWLKGMKLKLSESFSLPVGMILGALSFPAAMYAAELIKADYGGYCVPIVAAIYFLPNKTAQIAALVAGVAAINLPHLGNIGFLFGYRVSFGLASSLNPV